jgi:hypothetical protein
MKDESDLSYLSAFYYTAAVLLILTRMFAALSNSWGMTAACFISGSVLFSYRLLASKKQN